MNEVLTTRSARVNEIVRETQRRRLRARSQAQSDAWASLRRIGVGRSPILTPDRDLDAGKTLADVLPDGSWRGQRAFVIGGGPSLRDFDFSRLEGELVIGVNRAYEKLDCTVLYSMDDSFYEWARRGAFGPEALKRFDEFCGFRVWAHFYGEVPRGYFGIRLASEEGLPRSIADGIPHGNNSGYSALLLAYLLGADPIYLLGFDMKHQDRRTHWHSGYPHRAQERTLESFREPFRRIAPELERAGVKVVNLNPDSALDAFPKASFEDLSPSPMPRFVSYYTKGNGYDAEAEHLTRSLRRWNLAHEVRAVEDLGSWQKNTQYKARFLAEMMDRHSGQPIVWVDCDAVMAEYPARLKAIDADVAVRFRKKELLSGVVYLAPTAKARELVELWDAENRRRPDEWDQANLRAVLPRWSGRVAELPAEYCHIYDDAKTERRPVVLQYQASRRLKAVTAPAGYRPLVSVVMPAYNQGRFIRAAVESILGQSYREIELIVVDDGSTDGTADYLKTVTDPRVRVIMKENGGTGSALNVGFAAARGELETWFASDNVLYPQALERLVGVLGAHPGTDFAYGDADIGVMDETGLVEQSRSLVSREVGGQRYGQERTLDHYYFGIAWLWRKELRIRAGRDFQSGACEDYDMVLRMEEAGGRFELVPEPLAWFRRHRANMTARTGLPVVQGVKDKAYARRSAGHWHLAKVPKVMNFYWGSSTMPWLRYLTLQTFTAKNPGWKAVLWRPSTFSEAAGKWSTLEHQVPVAARDYWAEAVKLPVEIRLTDKWPELHEVLRSDRLRWEILARDGGGWSDMDIIYTRPLHELRLNRLANATLDFTVSIGGYLHSIGFILAAPGNPFYGWVRDKAERTKGDGLYQGYGALLMNRDFKSMAAIRAAFPGAHAENLEPGAFYGYGTHAVTETLYGPRTGERRTGPETIGVHWYAGHPKSGEAVNLLTHENWETIDMLVCDHIREALNG